MIAGGSLLAIRARAAAWLFVAVCLPSAASAQTGEVRCPTPGTQLSFSDGGSLESIGEAGEYICRFKSLRTGVAFERLLGAFLPNSRLVKANLGKFRSLVPLEVGKKVTFEDFGSDVRGADGAWTYTLSVEKFEQVTIPAGTFPAFVLLYDEQTFRGDGRWHKRFWYAPQIGYVVKYEYKMIHGHPPVTSPRDWTLVGFKPPAARQ